MFLLDRNRLKRYKELLELNLMKFLYCKALVL